MSRQLKPLAQRKGRHHRSRWQRRRIAYVQRQVTKHCIMVSMSLQGLFPPSKARTNALHNAWVHLPSYLDELSCWRIRPEVPKNVREWMLIRDIMDFKEDEK